MSNRSRASELKNAIPPLEFYRRELQDMSTPRRESEWVDGGLCPFHDDKKRGSFRVNLKSGGYKCFSCDASGGDIIDFVMKRYDLTFLNSIELISKRYEVTV